jgi:hypothetical protein
MLASTALNRAQYTAKIERDTIGVPGLEETQLLSVLNAANNEYIEAFKKGGGEPPEFMQAETGGTLASDTDLDGAVATTDTSIVLTDGSSASSSGGVIAVYDEEMPDLITYTGKSSNTLSGVTGIGFAHEDADEVSFLYALPSDFKDLRQQEGYGDGVQVDGGNYEYTSGTPEGTQFSIYDTGSVQYLWFPRDLTGDYSVYYNKETTTIDDTSDSIDIPDNQPHNQWFPIYRVVEYIFRVLGDYDRGALHRSLADKILADELKKKWVGKRPNLLRSARRLNDSASASSPHSFYDSRVGTRGFYR